MVEVAFNALGVDNIKATSGRSMDEDTILGSIFSPPPKKIHREGAGKLEGEGARQHSPNIE